MCRRLAELALELTENAAQAARAEWAAKPAAQAPEPEPRPQPPQRDSTSPSLAFSRYAHALRETIALEARLAADQAAQAERSASRATQTAFFRAEASRRQQPPEAPPPAPHHPRSPEPTTQTTQTTDPEIPSLLANLSRDLGIDLTDPTPSQRFPPFLLPPAAPPSG